MKLMPPNIKQNKSNEAMKKLNVIRLITKSTNQKALVRSCGSQKNDALALCADFLALLD